MATKPPTSYKIAKSTPKAVPHVAKPQKYRSSGIDLSGLIVQTSCAGSNSTWHSPHYIQKRWVSHAQTGSCHTVWVRLSSEKESPFSSPGITPSPIIAMNILSKIVKKALGYPQSSSTRIVQYKPSMWDTPHFRIYYEMVGKLASARSNWPWTISAKDEYPWLARFTAPSEPKDSSKMAEEYTGWYYIGILYLLLYFNIRHYK